MFTFFFNAGIMVTANAKVSGEVQKGIDGYDGTSVFGWYINPYIKKSIGGGQFLVGLKLASNGMKGKSDPSKPDSAPAVQWAIPIGLGFSF